MAFKISLNGSNYVSETREKAFEEALAESDQVLKPAVPTAPATSPSSGNGHGNGNGHHDASATSSDRPAAGAPRSEVPQDVPTVLVQDYGRVFEGLERGLAQSYDHQSEMLRVHQQYLNNQASYADIFAALMQEQGTLFTSDNTAGERAEVLLQVLQSLNRSVEQFHHHQSETLDVHGQFLQQQASYAQAFIELLQSHYGTVLNGNGHSKGNGGNGNGKVHDKDALKVTPSAYGALAEGPAREASIETVAKRPAPPVVAAQVPEPKPEAGRGTVAVPSVTTQPEAGPGVSVKELSAALLDIVSDKTGYPAEMLDLDMDMEADLGIDSIKRVEILGALQDAYPGLPDVEADTLAELRTLAQVLAYMSEAAPAAEGMADAGIDKPDAAAVAEAEASDRVVSPTGQAAGPIDVGTLSTDLLEIVSDKTGYPAEMLELDMDMEADLGIDSIKRVEILGALQDQHPDLPEVETDALAELRTLAQILDYMAQGVGGEIEVAGQLSTEDSKKV